MPILKNLQQHKVLLDTHIWLWYSTASVSFTENFQKCIEHNRNRHSALLSPMSIWEVGMLSEKGRIRLGMDPLDWTIQSLSATQFRLVPISPKIAIESTRLPNLAHGDPIDRILIATAHEENAVLITCDERILAYGEGKYLSAFDPLKKQLA